MNAPKAIVADDAILYGDLPNVSLVVGVSLEFPALEQSPTDVKNEFYAKWEGFVGNIPEKYALQMVRRIDGDYRSQLDFYGSTRGLGRFDRYVRNVNFRRYQYAQEAGELWNRKVDIFLSTFHALGGSAKNIQQRLAGSADGMRQFLEQLQPMVRAFGGTVVRHTTVTLARAIRDTLGGVTALPLAEGDGDAAEIEAISDYIDHAYPSGTIDAGEGILFHDGQYHRFLVMDNQPNESAPFMASDMMLTSHKDVVFSTSMRVLPKQVMLDKLQTRYNRIKADLLVQQKKGKHDVRAEVDLHDLEQSLLELKKGSGGVCHAIITAHLWAPDRDTLTTRVDEVRQNFALARGATLYESGLPAETRKLFFSTLPGYHGDWIKPFEKEFDAALGSRLLPVAAVFKGERKEPMALYQGLSKTLVGFSLFRGGRPLHTSIWGTTGVGKSAFCNDMLTQMNPYLDQIFIIESGYSYGVTVMLLGGKTIDLKLNGNQHLNLFDTHGIPLQPGHLSSIAAILFAMTGGGIEGYSREHVKSVLSRVAEKFLENTKKHWASKHPEDLLRVEREAVLFHSHLRHVGGDIDEAAEFLHFKATLDPALLATVTEPEVLNLFQNPETERFASRYVFSGLGHEDFELLEQFVDFLEHFSTDGKDPELRQLLSTLLTPWCGGEFGNLLNGYSNINLSGRLVHVELSGLGSNALLKSVVMALLNVVAFKDVLAAPRSHKKVWVFEELGALGSAMEGLGDIVKEVAQTGRKYNLCLVTIAQQFAAFAGMKGMQEATTGNVQQYVIFKQKSASDLRALLAETGLPLTLAQTIMDFPNPADTQHPKYASALLATETGTGWNIGTMLIHCPKAMIWAADSSGEEYDKKMKLLESAEAESFIATLLDDEAA